MRFQLVSDVVFLQASVLVLRAQHISSLLWSRRGCAWYNVDAAMVLVSVPRLSLRLYLTFLHLCGNRLMPDCIVQMRAPQQIATHRAQQLELSILAIRNDVRQ